MKPQYSGVDFTIEFVFMKTIPVEPAMSGGKPSMTLER